jgi:hypothetical protein
MTMPDRFTPRTAAAVAFAALVVTVALILAACGDSSEQSTGSASATPSGGAVQWDYVVIGDSAFAAPDNVTTVAEAQARLIKRDVGADVTVGWYYYPGSDTAEVLDALRTNDQLREAIASAEVVLFDVPVGELKQTIPWDDATYQALPGSPDRYRKGMARMLVDYRRDARAIVNEIVALRSPSEASIRAIDIWQLGYRGFRSLGVGAVMREAWLSINKAVDEACAAQGVTVVDAYTAFMGRNGKTDPITAGIILPDQMHLTEKGIAKLAALLHQEGYAEVTSP